MKRSTLPGTHRIGMLKNLKTHTSTEYTSIVTPAARLKLVQNCIPRFSRTGNSRKNASDGNTSQKIDRERSDIFSTLAFSTCIQIRARRDVSGREAIRAPKNELRFATSLTMTMTLAEIPTFSM